MSDGGDSGPVKYRISTTIGSPGRRTVRRSTRSGLCATANPRRASSTRRRRSPTPRPSWAAVGRQRRRRRRASVGVEGNGDDGVGASVGWSNDPARRRRRRGDEQRGNDHAFLREMTHRGRARIAGLIQRGPWTSDPYGHDRTTSGTRCPLSRRRFLRTSAMAVAGGVLFSCTGGRRIAAGRRRDRRHVDTRWPIKRVIYLMLENRSFNNLFGKFPGVGGTTVGRRERRREAADPVPRMAARRHPPRPGRAPELRERRRDGRLRHRDLRLDVRLLASSTRTRSRTTGTGRASTRSRRTSSRRRPGPATRTTSTSSPAPRAGSPTTPRTSGPARRTARASRAGAATRYGDDVFVFVKDDAGNLTKHDTCFEFPTVGEQLTDAGVDWAYYSAVPGQPGYFWNAYNGIANVFHTDLWHEHVRPVDRCSTTSTRTRSRRSPGSPRGSSSPTTRRSPRGHAHNWVTRDRERGDALRHVGAHGDLPDVGRVGRLLRPDRPAGGRPCRPRHPRSAAHDLAVHAPRRDRRRASASSRRRCGSSPTTGGSSRSPTGSGTRTTSSTSSTSRRPEGARSSAEGGADVRHAFDWDFPGDTLRGLGAGHGPGREPALDP